MFFGKTWARRFFIGLLIKIFLGVLALPAVGEEPPKGEAPGTALMIKPGEAPEVKEEPSPKLAATATVDFFSQYIFRGVALSRGPVLQPAVAVTYRGLAANVWGSFDPDERNPFLGRARGARWNETDFTLSYTRKVIKGLSLTGGAIYYAIKGQDSLEVYGGLAYAFPWLTAGFNAYREVSHFPGWFLQVYLQRSFPLPYRGMSLELYASFGFEISHDPVAFPDPGRPGRAFQGPLVGHLMAAWNIPVTKVITISPKIMYWYALGGGATRVLEVLSWDGRHNHLMGGVTITAAF